MLLRCATLWTCTFTNTCHLWNPYFASQNQYFIKTFSFRFSAFPGIIVVWRLIDEYGFRQEHVFSLNSDDLEHVLLQSHLAHMAC